MPLEDAPAVAERLARLGAQRIRGGLLSVEDSAALNSVGFDPVCEVIGAVANSVSPSGFYSSGGMWANPRGRTYTSSENNRRVGVPYTMIALKAGYRTMLTRLVAEATAAGADGVIDIRIERVVGHFSGTQLWTFLAVGTAVRSRGATRAPTPFTTDLSGHQVSAAVRAGWVPQSFLIAPCMAIRWVDYWSQTQRSRAGGNVEVDAYTDLVNTCRHQARQDFQRAAEAVGAEAAVLSDMTLEVEASRERSECGASVTVTGTALARFRPPSAQPTPLMIMPLRTTTRPARG